MTSYKVYQISEWGSEPREVKQFCVDAAKSLSSMYKEPYDWRRFNIERYAAVHRLMICRRDDEIVGLMMSRLVPSVFDPTCKILQQDLLHLSWF